ncbi:PRTRC system protein B [Chryseobacterium glaciei]|uniref:PRTRC system protein B n=1 Tax=Chryseobacterium glaciei TaxID=1685010 RepID=A0A172XTK8_9FLAO|nr:PRTRC system protein B [Chryseobacterium glaciei]ANF50291.1 PRTRC system protein B [Chryseobacterium glaciei]
MNNLTDITENFGALYHPKSALVFYETDGVNKHVYVEHFDMDKNGTPVNAHPLTVREANQLAKSLKTENKENQAFLQPKGILPTNVLQIKPSENGNVLWFTKAQERQLYFIEKLGIPNGKANIPPLLWFATKHGLAIYALKTNQRPKNGTPLYHAPFLNIYEHGNVCMGTVNVDIKKSASLEEFITAWENYFFNSYFSHLVQSHNPIKGNCVSLWKRLVKTNEPFPKEVLITNRTKIETLLR